MSSPSKSLMDPVRFDGKIISTLDALTRLHALPHTVAITTSEAAIFLRVSVTTLERLRKAGGGPVYIQGGSLGAKGTNQSCTYLVSELLAWQKNNTVSNSMAAALKKGQAFSTIFDLAEVEAYYIDTARNVESMVEENTLATVAERVGSWDIVWMNAVEAASRRWTSLASHRRFARAVKSTLSNASKGIRAGLESTDIAEVTAEPPPKNKN
jgi:hypothetical protein